MLTCVLSMLVVNLILPVKLSKLYIYILKGKLYFKDKCRLSIRYLSIMTSEESVKADSFIFHSSFYNEISAFKSLSFTLR